MPEQIPLDTGSPAATITLFDLLMKGGPVDDSDLVSFYGYGLHTGRKSPLPEIGYKTKSSFRGPIEEMP
jgi:hypothetical protein